MSERVGPPAPHVLETQIGDGVGLFAPGAEEAVVLNGTASEIWRLCDGESTAEGIVEVLAAAYRMDPDAIRQQVLDAIKEFQERGFFATEGET